ncbi:5'-nucleotidase C-terminal domain-containing protein [Gracilibacillus saliphilus]|uniref:5'-nucleotidase C-terminal domain-containing protein n=1 Tax=Gracilibacillus saliphilus TaxID=543890 RepID=UPI0013D31923|nr:5'-nucleotidase C-terminal domain-containing protein [Gracilibacillus saliphilus]
MLNSQQHLSRKFNFFLVIVAAIYLVIGLAIPTSAQTVENSDPIDLKILHTNDIHAQIEDFGKVGAYIQSEREESEYSMYLDAGDIFSGNPVVDLQFGKPIVDLLNDMELQAMAIGNHEFDYGQEEMVKRINQSDFHWLSANIEVGEGTEADVPQPAPYEIFDVNGLKVAVFSLTETPPSTAPAGIEGLTFNDPIETAKQYESELTEKADVLIALTHIGYSEDQKLAQEVDYFDVIIGGHSHTTLNNPNTDNGTPIVQTGGNAANIGNLTLQINSETKEVENVDYFLQSISSLEDVDDSIQTKVDKYIADMDELLSEEIGYTETGLSRNGSLDTPLGNFWTDAMRFKTDADIALTNGGGIRASIPAGPLTVNDIYTIEPFANEIMKLEMTGAALKDVMQYSYERDGRNRIDLQTSGLHYKVITNNAGKFIDVELEVDGEPVEEDQTYTVAVSDYIGTGGSGYHFEGEVLAALTGMMTDAMIDYAKHLTQNGEKINYSGNERIEIEIDNDAPIAGEVIGHTNNGLSSDNKMSGDASLGNLYTDAVRDLTGADFSMLNGSSVEGSIPAGDITDGQIEFLDGFGNEVVVVTTTVEEMKEIFLEQSNYHNGTDIQVSGLHYELVKENNSFVDVNFTLPDGTPLDESIEYTVAYNDYMHGSNYYQLGNETGNESYGKVWEAVVEYVTNHDGPIDYEEGTRITITDTPVEPPTEDGDFITVSQAIANNEGTETVRGYIVGTMTGNFDGDFTHTNLMLADSPDERNMDNIIPVQLPSGAIRNDLNLVDNPDNLGKWIEITGDLEAYFGMPGLKSPASFEWVEEEPTPAPNETITINEARNADDGQEVTIEGVVTTDTGNWGSQGFYVQDETAGIYIFQNELELEQGDLVQLTGIKGKYRGELQISSLSHLEKLGEGDVPAPIHVTPSQISSANEAQLVQLEGAVISELNEVNDYGTFEFNATIDGETVLVRVDNRTGLVFNDFDFANGDKVNIVGVSSQFDGTTQLKPRGANDIELYEEETPEPEDPNEEDPETPKQDHVRADVVITDQTATIIDESVELLNDNGTLMIDITDMESDTVQVDITSDQLAQLVQKNALIEIIREQEITLQIPASNFAENNQLSIALEKIDHDNPISSVYDLSIFDGEDLISEFDQAITLIFPIQIDHVQDTDELQVYYLNNQDEWEAIGGYYQEGTVTAATDHFSVFTVLEDTPDSEDPIDPVDPKDPSDPTDPKDPSDPTDPKDPKDPSDPTDPKDPKDPSDPTDPKEPSDPDNSNDSTDDQKDGEKSTPDTMKNKSEGNELPETATGTFNWLTAGLIILLVGAMILIARRNKKIE